jgi:hypothetical protein
MLDILEDFLYVLRDPSGHLAAKSAVERHFGTNKKRQNGNTPPESAEGDQDTVPFFRLDGNVIPQSPAHHSLALPAFTG